MIDLDEFTLYNDTYGQLVGDQVLIDLGNAVKNCTKRATNLTARFGGEEPGGQESRDSSRLIW